MSWRMPVTGGGTFAAEPRDVIMSHSVCAVGVWYRGAAVQAAGKEPGPAVGTLFVGWDGLASPGGWWRDGESPARGQK